MFKKSVLMLSIVAGTSAGLAQAADGTIDFTGEVVASACGISSDSKKQTIVMPTIKTASGLTAGDLLGSVVPFNIHLTDCTFTKDQAVHVGFGAKAAAGSTDVYALSPVVNDGSHTAAQGLGIIIKYDDKVVAPGAVTDITAGLVGKAAVIVDGTETSPAVPADNILGFTAQYAATQPAVTAGLANLTTDFTVTYQ